MKCCAHTMTHYPDENNCVRCLFVHTNTVIPFSFACELSCDCDTLALVVLLQLLLLLRFDTIFACHTRTTTHNYDQPTTTIHCVDYCHFSFCWTSASSSSFSLFVVASTGCRRQSQSTSHSVIAQFFLFAERTTFVRPICVCLFVCCWCCCCCCC